MKPNPTAGQGSTEEKLPDLFTRALAHTDVQAFMQSFPGARVISVERLPDPEQAQAMLAAFASVGANSFDVTLLDTQGREQGFQAGRSLFDLKGSINRRLKAAAETQHSVVIRPRSTTALLGKGKDPG